MECPVCFEENPLVQCSVCMQGICMQCKLQLVNCPICRTGWNITKYPNCWDCRPTVCRSMLQCMLCTCFILICFYVGYTL